jgi:hypothetical protein
LSDAEAKKENVGDEVRLTPVADTEAVARLLGSPDDVESHDTEGSIEVV